MPPLMPPPPLVKLGDKVTVPKGGSGTVGYVGQTDFASGTWVGIILDNPNGKNDGSVNGKRYFTSRTAFGMFVRPSQVTIVDQSKSSLPSALRPVLSTPSRLGLGISNMSIPPKSNNQPSKLNIQNHKVLSQSPSTTNSSTFKSPSIASNRSSLYGAISPPSRPLPTFLKTHSEIQTPSHNKTISIPINKSLPVSPSVSRRGSSSSNLTKRNSLSHTKTSTNLIKRTPSNRLSSQDLISTNSNRPPNSLAQIMSTSQSENPDNRALSNTPSLFEEDPIDGIADDDQLELDEITPIKQFTKNHQVTPELVPDNQNSSSNFLDHFSLIKSHKQPDLNKRTPNRSNPEPNSTSPYPNTVSSRVHEELLTKYKLMETRRDEDKEKIRQLEKAKEENENWLNVIKPKLQAKLNEGIEEIKNLKKLNKELETSRQDAENRLADFSDEVELATLDKEMAEEKLDQAETALVSMKTDLDTLKVELASLQEIQARIEKGQTNESDQSTVFKTIQLENQNLRLREALTRMRDLSHESEQASRKRIADLEQELDLSADLQGEYDVLLNQLEVAENQVEELKQQLDAAMGAEDMLEQLTERNLNLNEKIEDMKRIIEDLEALKELADELEENHVETEKQMQEEIDFKDVQLREQRKRNEGLEEAMADYENTILQFRELVLSLQTDLDAMRERQQIQKDESQTLASQTQAMLNLNRKLQNSSVKGQVKAIDLELRKIESTQALLQCTIMKPYLLPAYFEGDHDAVEALMFFTRLAAKTELVSMVIEQTNDINESLSNTVTDVIIIACDTRSKLARLSAFSNRFAAFIRSCPPESFIKMGGVYQELILAEKKMDAFIEACKREELKEIDVGKEIERFIPQMRHLAELYLLESEYDVAELQCGEINTLDMDLSLILACIGFSKQTIATIELDGQTDRDIDLSDLLFQPLQNLINQARTAKVISKKLLRRLQDLMQQSGSLNPNHSNAMSVLKDNAYDLANVSSRLADLVGRYCSELRSSKEMFQLETYNDILQEATRDIVKHTGKPLEEFFTLLSHLARDLGIALGVATDPEHAAKNTYEHPWVARVAEMKSSAAMNVDAEMKVLKLNEEIRELIKDTRAKDHSLQESEVKIQVMEKRMEAVKKQADAMAELESSLKKAEKEVKQYEELNESIQNEFEKMAEENKELKMKLVASGADASQNTARAPANSPKPLTSISPGQDFYVPYEGNLETTQLVEQIESLRGATRFLRAENSYLKSQNLFKQLNTLPSYSVLPPPFPPILEGDSDGVSTSGSIVSNELDQNNHLLNQPDENDQLRKLAIESTKLYKEALKISATPKVVDLTLVKRRTLQSSEPVGKRKVWQLKERLPQVQHEKRKIEVERLRKKIEIFKQRTSQVSI
ncbi:hypothetical protein O181_026507 [Austropuccinia psidii MF-1]|uniref:CAP-Gly domain-containing protein n=1 Tax=Austropuccinia psidii MF-1 TaxID=1389203 RepID=A0A9Q3H0U5_9BASI|nr:hypothetical protein [Austropuccinia psidii MF-1]